MSTPSSPIRIRTGSRLHFGLLDTVVPFGGCGAMIDGLGAEVLATANRSFSVAPDFCDRVERIADRVANHFGLADRPACRIEVLQSPPSHSGLGSGTQLSLAITEGMLRAIGRDADRDTCVRLSGRGRRSAVGVHGYFEGGFIAEGCTSETCRTANDLSINSVFRRIEFPPAWRVAILLPNKTALAVTGETEQKHFAKLCPATDEIRNALTESLLGQIIPAIDQGNFEPFAKHLEDYNRRSGELFAAVQGGPYNGDTATALVESAQRHGGHGVGQSSWGMGVFAWFATPSYADEFASRIASTGGDITCVVCRPWNQGRSIQSANMNPAKMKMPR